MRVRRDWISGTESSGMGLGSLTVPTARHVCISIVQSGFTRVLLFSDIHNDLSALRRLVQTEADYYVAAGDLVSWGRGLDSCGEILREKAGKVWAIPGNHESAEQIASFCARFGLRNIHDQLIEAGGREVCALGYSHPHP